jgi:hypothetical protein
VLWIATSPLRVPRLEAEEFDRHDADQTITESVKVLSMSPKMGFSRGPISPSAQAIEDAL